MSSNAVREWIEVASHPLHDLSALREIVGDAEIVGVGETTRASREIDQFRLHAFQFLVEELGFRVLAIHDSALIGERLDDLVRGSGEDPVEALGAAWPPWRTESTVEALQWIQAHNREHTDDPVRILGMGRPGAQSFHYDAVIDYVRRAAPARLDELKALLAGPRSAHKIDEHVQRFRGIHPGRPFAESARDAYELVAALPEDPERDHVLRYAQAVVDHHSFTVAAGVSFAEWLRDYADSVLRHYDDTGAKIVLWDGIAVTASARDMQVSVHSGELFTSTGGHLRERLGTKYLSMMIGFGEGEIHAGVKVPAPPADYVEAALATRDAYYLDLRSDAPDPVAKWRHASHKVRIISGVYDPSEDEKHHMVAPSFASWFDAVAYIPRISPTTLLKQAS